MSDANDAATPPGQRPTLPFLEPRTPAPAASAGYLLVFEGDSSRMFTLPREGELVIGRTEGVELRLDDAAVSRQHARLSLTRAGCALSDLQSQNGTFVNDERIEGPRALVSGDVIAICGVTLVFHAVGAGVATCPSDRASPEALLGSARAAALAAAPGDVVPATTTFRTFQIGPREIASCDPAMLRVFQLVERLARAEMPVLIHGETGTGKDVIASAIHHWSARAGKPFVSINCASIPDTLVESELFGYEKGAFSGAAASKQGLLEVSSGGTVFLDEVGELPRSAQAKLLRVLETKRVTPLGAVRERELDLRVVGATNRKLEEDAQQGRFRKDLYFRLRGATVWVPPLRDRGREVLLLGQRFLDEACARARKPPMTLTPGALHLLGAYDWPGNVRELKSLMDYAAAVTSSDAIDAELLTSWFGEGRAEETHAEPGSGRYFRPIDDEVRELERSRMLSALEVTEGHHGRAAALIGMPRRTFATKVKLYQLSGVVRPTK